jgi:hypothetical protein
LQREINNPHHPMTRDFLNALTCAYTMTANALAELAGYLRQKTLNTQGPETRCVPPTLTDGK